MRRYAHIRYPWEADIDVSSPEPAAFHAGLIRQALRYGVAIRRPRRLWAFASRHSVPVGALARGASLIPRHERPDLDRLLEDLMARWEKLATGSARIPDRPPRLTALAVTRKAGPIIFVFGRDPCPILVARVPTSENTPLLENEAEALRLAEGARLSPRYFGTVGAARVREGLEGTPLHIEPLAPKDAANLSWTPGHEALFEGFGRLAAATATPNPNSELHEPLQRALGAELSSRCKRLLTAAARDLKDLPASVLRHGDASPQNCLFEDDRLVGLVDWEFAVPAGTPAFDAFNAAVAYVDHGAALVRWSSEHAFAVFDQAWNASPFFVAARQAAREIAQRAGVDDRHLDALELGFFGWRLGRTMRHPTPDADGVALGLRALEAVAASPG